ncbi:uncharacterized protein LOC128997152 isoform X2 [Macrosteles quadrilineatus]|nr:uncharacterized protein LOC128997152 isoform X2 [Macrosteles quadrilineatus]
MSFLLTPAQTPMRRIKPPRPRKKIGPTSSSENSKHNASDDDMLIVNDKDEVVSTCKSTEISEDEYIYETLDDPDSALEIMKEKPPPKVKPTAIRSGAAIAPTVPRFRGSGRIRKVTSKMQNSFIAKKLKQAQQILQESDVSVEDKKPPLLTPQKASVDNAKNDTKRSSGAKTVLHQDNTTRHVATVNPNMVRLDKITDKNSSTHVHDSIITLSSKGSPEKISEAHRPFKVIKLKGKNPIIFSPEQLPDIQSFLKAEASSSSSVSVPEQNELKTPLLKIKSVDNLNKQNVVSAPASENKDNNLDIIHSVGLVRRNTVEKCAEKHETSFLRNSLEEPLTKKISHQSYSRAYSWNRPGSKTANKQTANDKIQPDSQTNDYEIEETWNDIKQENIEDMSWHPEPEMVQFGEYAHTMDYPEESPNNQNMWNKLSEAKLELVAYQRKMLEEQHKKTMEYMKKEHDLKMTLLKAEIDLKRKQLNIML